MSRIEHIAEGVTLYLGDCRDIVPSLPAVDAVVTDPPYPDYHVERYRARDFDPTVLDSLPVHQFVFWSPKADFPLDHSAVHIWHKTGAGDIAAYERIYERNGSASYCVFIGNPISNPTMARFAKDEWHNHPSQKPVSLLRELIQRTKGPTVCDPFMGSGSTGVAAVSLGRRFVGIEMNVTYFDTACRRIADATKQQDLFIEKPKPAKQEALL